MVIEVFSDLILGSSLSSRFRYCHFPSVVRVSPDGCFDDSLFRGEPSPDKDKVSFGYRSAFELCGYILPGKIVLGNHYEAGGVFVQSVNYARAHDLVAHRQTGAVGQDGIDQRMTGMSRRRMDCQASRLVYDHDILILIDYSQGDWFRQRTARGGRELDRYRVATGQSLARLCSLAIDQNVTLPN